MKVINSGVLLAISDAAQCRCPLVDQIFKLLERAPFKGIYWCIPIYGLQKNIKNLLFVPIKFKRFVLQPVIEFSSVSVPQCLKKFLIYTVGVIKKLSEEGGQSIAGKLEIWMQAVTHLQL